MKTVFAVLALAALGFAPVQDAEARTERPGQESIWVGTYGDIDRWKAVGRNQIVVWTSPSRPYLVTIRRSVPELRFVNAIAVTKTGGRITHFDKVIIEGRGVPIKSIRAIEPAYAKSLRWPKSKAQGPQNTEE